jgi:LysR family transcriptional regulator, transcriptional activator of the cysJI operon
VERVNPANLRLIRDIAALRSISKAARQSGMSQSAASQRIQELESSLHQQLFDRTTRPLTVTPAGKLYVDFCRDVLRRHDEFEASLGDLKKQANGTVRLAAIYSVGLSDMSAVESRFAGKFPDAELQISYLRPERVLEAVREDRADLGLVSYAESSRDLLALPWRDEEMVVAVAPGHRLAKRSAIPAAELEGEDFVGFDEDLPIQGEIERYLRAHRVHVDIVLRFDNLQMIKEAVALRSGLSILPLRAMAQDIARKRLVALRLHPAELFRPVRIVQRRRKTFNQAAEGLLAILKDQEATFSNKS